MRKCGSTKDIQYMNGTKGARIHVYKVTYRYEIVKDTHESAKGKLERHKGGLEGWSSERSAGGPCYRCATLISKGGNPHAPAPGPGHENPGESVKLPRRV